MHCRLPELTTPSQRLPIAGKVTLSERRAQHPFRSSIAGYLPAEGDLDHSGPHQFDGPLAGGCISDARAISQIPGHSGLTRWTC